MINRKIIAGSIVLAFVGVMLTGTTIAYGASNGQPFKDLQDQVDEIITVVEPVIQFIETTDADSFFDVFVTQEDHDEDISGIQSQIDDIETSGVIGSYLRETTALVPEGSLLAIPVECDEGDINTGGYLKGTPAANHFRFGEYETTEKFIAWILNTAGEGDIFATVQSVCLDMTS